MYLYKKDERMSVNDDHCNIRRRRSSHNSVCTVHLQVLKFDLMIFLINYSTEKLWPDGQALAFQECKLSQSCYEAVKKAQPTWAWLGLAHPYFCLPLPSLLHTTYNVLVSIKNMKEIIKKHSPRAQTTHLALFRPIFVVAAFHLFPYLIFRSLKPIYEIKHQLASKIRRKKKTHLK